MKHTDKRTDMKELGVLPTQHEDNLSDFALFLSVMRNKTAYEIVLRTILGEPDLTLEEVKVEELILNQRGRRAIRLDAWARAEDERCFATEMQNEENDVIPKRSRFYQSVMDSPLLKAGKGTKYKHLPPTVIIFITQKDIFQRDSAKYTFTERCHEFPELELQDGTTKIFLNMSSTNGEPELISLLQYMKDTTLENPDIIMISPQLVELDKIVNEVRESTEWEDMKMNLIQLGREQGIEQGMAKERENTERERKRADKATQRAKKAIQRNKQLESELSSLRMQLAQLTQTP